jgi:hypothetical protein
MKTVRIFPTWLPIFHGFYNTLFEGDDIEEQEIQNYNESNGTNLDWDDFNFDYVHYRNTVSKACVEYIETKLKELCIVSKIRYEAVSSPKEYNFTNDSINIEVTLNNRKLRQYLGKYILPLTLYIKNNYTSCDGFTSFYSNDIEEWKTKTVNFRIFDKHELGALLNFICENEGVNYGEMYEETNCYFEMNISKK